MSSVFIWHVQALQHNFISSFTSGTLPVCNTFILLQHSILFGNGTFCVRNQGDFHSAQTPLFLRSVDPKRRKVYMLKIWAVQNEGSRYNRSWSFLQYHSQSAMWQQNAQFCSEAPGITNIYQVPLNTLRTQFLQELRRDRTVSLVKRLILTRQGDRSESRQKLQSLHSWFSWIHQLCHCRQWFQLDRQKWSPGGRRKTQHIFLEKQYKQLIC